MTLSARIQSLEKNCTGSLTAGMSTEEALSYYAELPLGKQPDFLRRMTDEELAEAIAYLTTLATIATASEKPKKKGRR